MSGTKAAPVQTLPPLVAGSAAAAANDPAIEPRILTPEAQRALAEAAERRAKADEQARLAGAAPEVGGRGGLDPIRYGDWEKGGLTSDF